MNSLEISNIGAACGKNPYESKDKIILSCLCKKYKSIYIDIFYSEGIVCNKDLNVKTYDAELKKIYCSHKKEVSEPQNIPDIKETIIKKLKRENTQMTDKDLSHITSFLDNSLKKDCGINSEQKVINTKRYKSGNNNMYTYAENNWQIRGLHDATDNDIVIEIKTRMSEKNVRKNEYDLYQLFGYLLAMSKTKGKIVQYFNKNIFDSDVETNYEYGIIDINEEIWGSKFKNFLRELNCFFCELSEYTNRYKPENIFNVWKVFNKTELPIAIYDIDRIAHNINPKYEKIIKSLII